MKHSRTRAALSLALLLAAGASHAADTPAATTDQVTAAPALGAADQALLAALNAALQQADTALAGTGGDLTSANSLRQTLLGDVAPDAALSLPARLNAVGSLGLPARLSQVAPLQTHLASDAAPLTAALTALTTAAANARASATAAADAGVQAALALAGAPAQAGPPAVAATGRVGAVQARMDALAALAGDGDGSLADAVHRLTQAVAALAAGAGTAIAQNPALSKGADAAHDRENLSAGMGGLADALTARARFTTLWNSALRAAAQAAAATDGDLKAVDAALTPGQAEKDAATGLAARFGALAQNPAGTADMADPAAFSAYAGQVQQAIRGGDTTGAAVAQAPAVLGAARTTTQQLRRIVDSWQALYFAWLQDDPADAAPLAQADTALGRRAPDIALVADAVSRLDEALTGDLNHFVSDQVRLFYFTDVQRLMQALNPDVSPVTEGTGDPQAKAGQARQDLVIAEAGVAQGLGAVAEAKTRLRTIQEDLRQAAAAVNAAARADTAKKALVTALQARQTADDPSGAPTTASTLAAQIQAAQTDEAAAGTALTTAQQHQSDVQTESGGLPQRLLDAQAALSGAQQALDKQRVLAAGLAQVEAEAFGSARDHAPYFRTNARALSTDPGRRVILLGYPDSETLFIRGLAPDVEAVKEMIAQFDRPAPQARITLWTLQVNGTDPEKLADTMQNIDQHLLLTRTLTGLVQDRLRDALSFVVAHVADRAAPAFSFLPDDDSRARLLRCQFYSPEVLRRLGYNLTPAPDTLAATRSLLQHDLDRLGQVLSAPTPDGTAVHDTAADLTADVSALAGAMTPYNVGPALAALSRAAAQVSTDAKTPPPRTLQADTQKTRDAFAVLLSALTATPYVVPAASAPSADMAADDAYVTRFTLPDPAHGTTLGEMLFVLSLGRQEYREAVLTHFLLSLEAIPADLPGFGSHHDDLSEQKDRLQQFTKGLGVIARRNLFADQQNPNSRPLSARMMLSPFEMDQLNTGLQKLAGDPTQRGHGLSEDANGVSFFPRFPNAILGSYTDFGTLPLSHGTEEMTANQNEILLAVQTQARENVANEVKHLLRQMDELKDPVLRAGPLGHQLRMQYLPLVGFLYTKYYSPQGGGDNLSWLQRGLLATGALHGDQTAPLDFRTCESALTTKEEERGGPLDVDRQAWQIASLSGQHNSLAQAIPRVAAADDMIKRLIIAVEDDLAYFFVEPELAAIRQDTARTGLQLGTFQRESLLATNRRVARVDPSANADVELSGGTDFLQEATQLGQVFDGLRQRQTADNVTTAVSGAAGGVASALGKTVGTSLGIGAAFSLLGDLLTSPQPVGEIYSINSGSLFKVTPIFDPSGQALRFQFDYAGTTRVREPDGTTDPSLPRVERHTVNTDVELSNLELREVSRFESNSALGTPEQRTGGLPILKHLPILKDIPIIGYFTRTDKKGAVRQESLIFAQTSLYPTVADIVDLLVDIPPLPVTDSSEPAYLTSGAR